MEPTPQQIEAYRRDGFLVVEEFLPPEEVEAVRGRWERVFKHEWETGIAPDEVNYTPGETPPDRTRQLCNAWKADRVIAATTLACRNAEFAAKLAGVPGLRVNQDNLIWKPPRGKALLMHQDGSYLDWLAPPNMITCWMALDDTRADSGTISYARGSHRWPHVPVGGAFHAPDDWLSYAKAVMPPGATLDLVPIEVPAGGAAIHDAWVFHGSPANDRADTQRRAIISHLMHAETQWNPAATHPIYSRYRRPGETTMDEAFFPILWREDSYRTPWVDEYVGGADL